MTKSKALKSHSARLSDRVAGIRALIIFVLALIGATPILAQEQSTTLADRGVLSSPILTIDSDRVFQESAFGLRVAQEIELEGAELAKENNQIASVLEEEEQALTDKRDEMTPDEFRVLANAFDKKVQQTRQEQAAKGRALNALLDQEREIFLTAAAPVLERLMREAGAAVILDTRTVFVSASVVEITDDAIALLNETLGGGEDVSKP
jgi:Skp family chaperone for outer membrane proteins